jgi:hypothetical protein
VADTPIDERRFTDQEVREILKRAVKSAPSHAMTRSEGLSLAELKAIGEEVGIDAARLEAAAQDVAMGRSRHGNLLVGSPTVMTFERKVGGAFDAEATPEILSVIRRTMGVQGEVNEVHGSLEWRAEGDIGARYVTLSSRDGVTTINGSSNLNSAAVVTFLPAGLVGLITSLIGLMRFVQHGSQVGLILFFTVLPVLYPILRWILRKVTSSESAKLQQVVDELARLTERSGSE